MALKKKLAGLAMSAIMAVTSASAMATPVNATTITYNAEYYGSCSVTAYYQKWDGEKGARGTALTPGISVAASRSIPFGTKLYVDGYGIVEVEDRTAKWYEDSYNGMVIDLYLPSYSDAVEWGRHELDVYILSDETVEE
jgi:3D (Asp-Asp-Asp) domain-containing protein